ncbi:MAG: hypothetical protein OXC66_10100 [Roseovarius sp.]|nr:hypothetical protein [Roseovarius sp.]
MLKMRRDGIIELPPSIPEAGSEADGVRTGNRVAPATAHSDIPLERFSRWRSKSSRRARGKEGTETGSSRPTALAGHKRLVGARMRHAVNGRNGNLSTPCIA